MSGRLIKPLPEGCEDFLKELGKRINIRRLDQGLSMDALSKKLGFSWQMLSAIERGEKIINITGLKLLCDELNLSIAQILPDDTEIDYHTFNMIQRLLSIKKTCPQTFKAFITLVENFRRF